MFTNRNRPVYINQKSGKVIQLREDDHMTAFDVVSPFMDKELLPEGIHDVMLSTRSSYFPKLNWGNAEEWIGKQNEVGTRISRLFLYEHGGLSVSTGHQCDWDTSTLGSIGVKADTDEQAQEYLDKIVAAWDDFLQFGSTSAYIFESLAALLTDESGYEDIVAVTGSLTEDRQIEEAAGSAELIECSDWVPIVSASSALLKALQVEIASKNVDEMSDSEVRAAVREIKRWASLI